MRKNIIVIGIILCFLLMNSFVLAGERIPVKYLKTSDGDTMRVELNGENVRVRFLGINTPEVSGEDKVEEPFGNEALAYTKKKLDNAKKIEIEYDAVADHEDRFGRHLAWIWVDDKLFEIELLEQGLAKTYMLKNNYQYASELKAAEEKAQKAKIGVWTEEEESTVSTSETKQPETVEGTEEMNQKEVFSKEEAREFDWENVLVIVVLAGIILFWLKSKK